MANEWRLTRGEHKLFRSLNTPLRVQKYIEDKLVYNFDTVENGDPTCYSPKNVLETGKAHCFEGAMFAAAAFMINGLPSQLIDLGVKDDEDHVLALHWRTHEGIRYRGTVGMSGYHLLMWRDAIYRTPRELGLSFVEGYHPMRDDPRKSLRTYSTPVDMHRFNSRNWIASDEHLYYIGDALNDARHYPLFPSAFGKTLRPVHTSIALANARFEGK